ncbi:hypothetical protein N2152v2_002826 [Parachlorella kessleri]
MSATQCISRGSPITISGALGVLKKFFEPGWELRTAADVEDRRPYCHVALNFLKKAKVTSLAASFLHHEGKAKPDFTCPHCGAFNPSTQRGPINGVPRCGACYQYYRKKGVYRPQKLFAKATK